MRPVYQRIFGGRANQFFIKLANNKLTDVTLEYSFYQDQYHWLYGSILSFNGVAKREAIENIERPVLPYSRFERILIGLLSLSIVLKFKSHKSLMSLNLYRFKNFDLISDYCFNYSRLLNWHIDNKNLAFDYFDFKEVIVDSDYAVMHVRKGDFVGNGDYDICDSTWFYDAVRIAQKPKLWIVTDDLVWVSDNLSELNTVCTEIRLSSSKDDWSIMASSNCLIISNSTFSLTAASFGCKDMVIGPKNWVDSARISKVFQNWIWI